MNNKQYRKAMSSEYDFYDINNKYIIQNNLHKKMKKKFRKIERKRLNRYAEIHEREAER